MNENSLNFRLLPQYCSNTDDIHTDHDVTVSFLSNIRVLFRVIRLGISKNEELHKSRFNRFILSNMVYIWFFIVTILYEISAVFIMDIISLFYQSISDSNKSQYFDCILRSIFIITIVSILKSFQMVFIDASILYFRKCLTNKLNIIFINNTIELKSVFDNIDQRITQDIDIFSAKLITLISKLLCIPFILCYYTFILIQLFGWNVAFICYVYFILGTMTTGISYLRMIYTYYKVILTSSNSCFLVSFSHH